MSVIWISYELDFQTDDASYARRYNALTEEIASLGTIWDKTTSFVLVETNLSYERVAARLAKKIDPRIDLLLVGSMTVQGVATVGKVPNRSTLVRLCPGGVYSI